MAQTLAREHTVDVETDPQEALFQAAEGDYDLAIISLGARELSTACGCASHSARSTAPALCRSSSIAEADDNARLMRGLEIGVNDYLIRPIDRNETAGAGAHPGPAEALRRPPARQRADVDRDGDHRRADRPA